MSLCCCCCGVCVRERDRETLYALVCVHAWAILSIFEIFGQSISILDMDKHCCLFFYLETSKFQKATLTLLNKYHLGWDLAQCLIFPYILCFVEKQLFCSSSSRALLVMWADGGKQCRGGGSGGVHRYRSPSLCGCSGWDLMINKMRGKQQQAW